MGSCLSSPSTSEVTDHFPATAKVITIDGSLIEYSVPANVSQILDKDYSSSFLCSSDELFFDERIPALGSHDWVELGQIYFILPRSMLHHPLTGEDMAALAVKASLALAGALEKRVGRAGKQSSRVSPVRELNERPTQTFEVSNHFKTFEITGRTHLRRSTKEFPGRAVQRGCHHTPKLSIIEE